MVVDIGKLKFSEGQTYLNAPFTLQIHINRAKKQSGPPQSDAATVAKIFIDPFEDLE